MEAEENVTAFSRSIEKSVFSCRDLGRPSDRPVFVNEHLCAAIKALVGQGIARKKEIKCRFVWARNGTNITHKVDDAIVVQISCVSDLEKLQ